MRGGTTKGVIFRLEDLPVAAQAPGPARVALLLRVIGSPDPYGKQIDGMGGATSSTSKTVILSRSSRPDHDVDYLFGQVSIDKAFVDWSGNCGNLSAAVGPFAIGNGLVDPGRIPQQGTCTVRIWQANIGKTIVAHVPIANGAVQETGDFELDGVTFPAAEVQLEFMDPAADEDDAGGAMFPTGNLVDDLEVPGVGTLRATMINAGIPTVFVNAEDVGYTGTELQDAINGDAKALAMFAKPISDSLVGSIPRARSWLYASTICIRLLGVSAARSRSSRNFSAAAACEPSSVVSTERSRSTSRARASASPRSRCRRAVSSDQASCAVR
jgi:probable AcnD-accessory protein PrpF